MRPRFVSEQASLVKMLLCRYFVVESEFYIHRLLFLSFRLLISYSLCFFSLSFYSTTKTYSYTFYAYFYY